MTHIPPEIGPELTTQLATQSLERASHCILWLDDSLRITYANSLTLSILNTSPNKLFGTPIYDIDTLNSQELWEQARTRAKGQGLQNITVLLEGYSLQSNLSHVQHDQTSAFALTSLHPPADTTHNPTHSQFLARMSHELRTPLNSVLGYAKLLELDPDLNEEQRHKANTIHQSGTHLLNLINDILDLSRADTGHLHLTPAPFHLLTTLQNTLNLVRLRANRKRLSLQHNISPDLNIHLNGDSHKLRQVLINLLTNAIKFTDTGTVSLDASLTARDETSATIEFRVRDSGIGIPKHRLKTIFAPFQHIPEHNHTAQQGAGLGLNITKRLVRLMGGSIVVHSTPERGSTFEFSLTFPLAHSIEPTTTTLPNDYKGPTQSILIVDDNPNNRAVLRSMLSLCAFQVHEVPSGTKALEYLEDNQFDAVLLDLHMPNMDGYETVQHIRKSVDEPPPVIACSSSVSPHDRQESLDAGFDDFIPRPIQIQTLLDTLQRHLDVQWIYNEASQPKPTTQDTIQTPPPESLTRLHKAAKLGRVRIIKHELKRLRKLDTEDAYTSFWDSIRDLLRTFDIAAICEKTSVHKT